MPDHEALRALLQDRKSSTKGRASRRMAVCLSAPLSMALAEAEADLAAAKSATNVASESADKRAGGKVAIDPELNKQVTAAEKAVSAAEAEVDAASVVITFTALKAHEYDELLKEHPPREGNELDALNDVNQSTFPDALMVASATKIEDAEGNLVDMNIEDLIGEFSNGERILACQVANDVNLRTSTFSDAKSQSRQRSGSNSKRR